MGVFATIYHSTMSFGARVVINRRIARYGKMPELHLNLTDRHVEGEIVLKGESGPIHFAADYALENREIPGTGVGPVVTLTNIVLSREWMQRVAEDMVAGKPLPIPPDAAKWMRMAGVL